GNEIAPGTITSDNIQDGSIQAGDLALGAITSGSLGTDSVGTTNIQPGAVTTDKVADGAVTTQKIADGAVTNTKIGDGAVDSRTILDGSIATADIADGAITNSKIVGGAVDSRTILDRSIANVDIADGAVDSRTILDGSIKAADVDSSQVQLRITPDCPSGQVMSGVAASGAPVCVLAGQVGPGTLNRVAKFTPDGTHVGDSSITDNGASVIVPTQIVLNGNNPGTRWDDADLVVGTDVSPNRHDSSISIMSAGSALKLKASGSTLTLNNWDNQDIATLKTANGIFTGKVGIGTASPNSYLHVDTQNTGNGALLLTRAADRPALGFMPWASEVYISSGTFYKNNAWIHQSNDDNSEVFAMDPGVGTLWYASSDRSATWNVAGGKTLWDMGGNWKGLVQSTQAGNSYFTGGNVGIGTTAPIGALSVVGSKGPGAGLDGNGAPNGIAMGVDLAGLWSGIEMSHTSGGYIDFSYPSNSDPAQKDFRGRILYSNGDNTMHFYTGGNYERLTINSAGDVKVRGSLVLSNDGAGERGWGTSVIDGRVWSASNNIHISPPGDSAVYIDSNYRDAGGAGGNVNLCLNGACISSWPTSLSGGVANTLPKWTSATTLGNSVITESGGNVGIGGAPTGYKLTVGGDIYANGGWLRTSGNTGWYSETYQGGWYMSDATWIRAYNSKNVWVDAVLGTNGGLTAGYGGATPPAGGAIIAGNVGIG
ncbi:MAG: shufflon system plasmid conjugative transfer pilus tip adhesin PilV, partial [Nanoarchaeota archaeon]